MAIECVCQAVIKASPEQCLTVAADAARWPEWARDIDRVTVHQPATDKLHVTLVASVGGEKHDTTVRVEVDRADRALTIGLIESRQLESFAGRLQFAAAGTGSRMDAELSARLQRPVGSRLSRMASRRIETALTRDLVRYIQRLR